MDLSLHFDNAATTPLDPAVRDAMLPFLGERFGNASALHPGGVEARYAVEKARQRVARAIGAEPEEIVFTASGTESANLALRGVARAARRRNRGEPVHVVAGATEHRAVLETLRDLECDGLFDFTLVPVDQRGIVDPHAVESAIRPETRLLTFMLINSETGAQHPIETIAVARDMAVKVAQTQGISLGIPFHCDACQAIGKMPIDVGLLGIDLLTLNGHKFHGPQGVGALWIKSGVEIAPVITGGGQERGLRAGTENVAGIVGLGAAIGIAQERMLQDVRAMDTMRARIAETLTEVEGVHVNSPEDQCAPHILNLGIEGLDGRRLVSIAGEKGICLAAGSACSMTGTEPSHVLTAMGLPLERVRGAIRISLGRFNTQAGVDRLLAEMPDLIAEARRQFAAESA
jgi:cysteine desulfurase